MPKSKSSAKDARIEIRLPEEDKELLAEAAEEDGRTLSGWIRHELTKAARKQLGKR